MKTELKCVKCWLEKEQDRNSEYLYHGFSLCPDHFKAWHKLVLDERDKSNSTILKPGG